MKQEPQQNNSQQTEGILVIDKPKGITSFDLVRRLRKVLGVKKIGHTGTLDPFATGVMILLVGRAFTRLSDKLLQGEKEYVARIQLGISTDTFDCEGKVTQTSSIVPCEESILKVLQEYQGELNQKPPMFSAKKVNGKKLYELAREGKTIERELVKIFVKTEFLAYHYPYLDIRVICSKGTYIRSLADDIGNCLGAGGHLVSLRRTRNGQFLETDCLDGGRLQEGLLSCDDLKACLRT